MQFACSRDASLTLSIAMAIWHEPDFQRDLRRLLRHARTNAGAEPSILDSQSADGFIFRSGVGVGVTYSIEGEDLALLRSLQRRLPGSSRADSGTSPSEARVLLLSACDEAVATTINGAVAAFITKLEAPREQWVIAEPIGVILPTRRLKVGRTTYSRDVPRSVASRRVLDQMLRGFEPPIAFATVSARDADTANVLARERFAESAAILDVASSPRRLGAEVTARRRRNGGESAAFRKPRWILTDGLVDERGHLVPPFRQLSRAAAREEDRQSDWERRMLAATRWFSRSAGGDWPADRLASLMVALECLFVAGRTEKGRKGALIAERFTERFRLRDKAEDEQRAWLATLYSARNDAVHEGRQFADDLEVDRLLEATQYVIRTMAWHLVPAHRRRGRSCRNFAEVMRCGAP